MGKAPKYFDYLHKHGQYLTDLYDIQCEGNSLEADIAHYRRRRSDEGTYWIPAVYLRRLTEQIVDNFLQASPYEYSKELGKKLHEGIDDGTIPRTLGHRMSALNELVRDGAHFGGKPYTATDLESALIQLDVVFRTILRSEGKPISGDEVASGTDEVLLAHSDSIEEKASQAAQLTGNKKLIEESRENNRRAIAAERSALAARKQVQEAAKENEQLRLKLADAMETIKEQKAALSKKATTYAQTIQHADSAEPLFEQLNARVDAKAAALESSQARSDAQLAKAKRLYRVKESAADEAAKKVTEYEEYLDGILNEFDFIRTLLGAQGKATDEQRHIVNYPSDPTHKSRLLKVIGKAGTGKTLCLLAATINYLEPNRQGVLSYGDQSMKRCALFVCYNKDLACYISGLLERFPNLSGSIEVANYDQFLNQFVRTSPIDEYKHLAEYAKDVRFHQKRDSKGVYRYWDLLVEERDKKSFIRRAIVATKSFYLESGLPEFCGSTYLDESDDFNVNWMTEEIEWLEGRYHDIDEGLRLYPGAERVGRGNSGRRPAKNSVERTHVTNVWIAYRRLLEGENLYTLQQVVTKLLRSNSLPTYDIVAIDEAQDLNMLHIELFTRFMKEKGYLLIAGDEGQRIYPRDFSWKEVDSKIRPITLSLSTNKRNPIEIRRFAERLEADKPSSFEVTPNAHGVVQIERESKECTVERVKKLASHRGETTVVVTSKVGLWESLLQSAGIHTETSKDRTTSAETIRMKDGGVRPGVYCFSQLKTKGLEFDNVIIDYDHEIDQHDEKRERRIRYMQFTRARKTLLVRYEDEPPALIQKYYPEYLSLQN